MTIKIITISSILFIFGSVIQVWADSTGPLNGTYYQENVIEMKKLEERHQPSISYKDDEKRLDDAFLESPKANKKLNLTESIDKIFSLYKLFPTTWRYKILDHQGIKETKSPNSEYGQSILKLSPNVNRYFEGRETQVTFDLLQSKLKRTEIFILFHLSFNPKWDQRVLEMYLTPSSSKGVNFFIPF